MDGATFGVIFSALVAGIGGLFGLTVYLFKDAMGGRDARIATMEKTEEKLRAELKETAIAAATASAKQLEAARATAETYAEERKALIGLIAPKHAHPDAGS